MYNRPKILLLCGGKGERLKPLTNDIPKPLVSIQGKPILNYLLSYFHESGFDKFVIAVGYKADKFNEYFQKEHLDLSIEIIDSGEVDILVRIQNALALLNDDFIMCYGDTLADVSMDRLINFHHNHAGKLTLTTYPLKSPFGIVDIAANGKVNGFTEKPVLDKWINIGYFYFSRDCRSDLMSSNNFVEYLQGSIERNEMYSFCHDGIHITVNTLTELQEAENNIEKFTNSLTV